ncbi:hypothetical protein DOA20_25885 [Salmonella enterica subsp. enterica serovar Newport]|nr:hypothetical protein [Salmonella enterica subsp. enterica serovar Newport]
MPLEIKKPPDEEGLSSLEKMCCPVHWLVPSMEVFEKSPISTGHEGILPKVTYRVSMFFSE